MNPMKVTRPLKRPYSFTAKVPGKLFNFFFYLFLGTKQFEIVSIDFVILVGIDLVLIAF